MLTRFRLVGQSLTVGFLAWLASIFLYSPRFTLLLGEAGRSTRRDDLLAQCVDPFTRALDEPLLFYRILQPLIAHSLGWCGPRTSLPALLGSPGIAYGALVLCLALVYWLLAQRFATSLALLCTFVLATTQVAQWTNIYWGFPDSLSLLPAAALLCWKRPAFVFACVTLGTINDERFLLAMPFVLIWWWPEGQSLVAFIRNSKLQIIAFAFAIAMVLLIRAALLHGIIGPGIDYHWGSTFAAYALRFLQPLAWPGLMAMVIMSFRWLWIMPLILIFSGFISGAFQGRLILYSVSILAVILASIAFSADVSRNIAFAFPLVIVSLDLIVRTGALSQASLSRLMGFILLLNVISPAATFYDLPRSLNPLDWESLYLPLPVNVFNWLSPPG